MQNVASFLITTAPLEAASQADFTPHIDGGDLFADIMGALPDSVLKLPETPEFSYPLLLTSQQNPVADPVEIPGQNMQSTETVPLSNGSVTSDVSQGTIAFGSVEPRPIITQHIPTMIAQSGKVFSHPYQITQTVQIGPEAPQRLGNSNATQPSVDQTKTLEKPVAIPKADTPEPSPIPAQAVDIQANTKAVKYVHSTHIHPPVEFPLSGMATPKSEAISQLAQKQYESTPDATKTIQAVRQAPVAQARPSDALLREVSVKMGAKPAGPIPADDANRGPAEPRKSAQGAFKTPEFSEVNSVPSRPDRHQSLGPVKVSIPATLQPQTPKEAPQTTHHVQREQATRLPNPSPTKSLVTGQAPAVILADHEPPTPVDRRQEKTSPNPHLILANASVQPKPVVSLVLDGQAAQINTYPATLSNTQPHKNAGTMVIQSDAGREFSGRRIVQSDRPDWSIKAEEPGKTNLTKRAAVPGIPAMQTLGSNRVVTPQIMAGNSTPAINTPLDDVEFGLGSQISTVGSEAVTSAVPRLAHEPALARHVAVQLADVARAQPDRPMEITLNPEELGRVRLSFSGENGNLTISVTTERPETLDLMRRNIEILAQELRSIGYGKVGFAFGQSGEGGLQNGADQSDQTDAPDDTVALETTDQDDKKTTPPQPLTNAQSGIDIRL